MTANSGYFPVEIGNPVKNVAEEEPLVTEIRLNAGECFALVWGMHEVRHYAREAELHRWAPELNADINLVARYLVTFSEDKCSKSHRVRLDALSLAFAMFGLGRLQKDLKRGLFKDLNWPNPVSIEALRTKLEKYRKRAKRLWLRREGGSTYSEKHRLWREFLTWVHTPVRFQPVETARDLRRKWLRIHVGFVKRVLMDSGFSDVPDESALGMMVRKMVKNARRGRGEASTRDICKQNEPARRWILKCIPREIQRMRNALIAKARVDENCRLFKSVAGYQKLFEDYEDLAQVDWLGISAKKMSLRDLQQACRGHEK